MNARNEALEECDRLADYAECMRDVAEKNLDQRQRVYVDLAKGAVWIGVALVSGYTFYGILRLAAMVLRVLKVNIPAF